MEAANQVLIIQDERPAMDALARELAARTDISSTIVTQEASIDLSRYLAVLVYIHGSLEESTEHELIDYTRAGGKLILLHHSISSGKRRNRHWFPFLGITLPPGDPAEGGYQYIDHAAWDIVNIAPQDPVVNENVPYDHTASYQSTGDTVQSDRPAFHLNDSEVYLNHVLTGSRTVLLGMRYTDPRTGITLMQDTAGWYRRAEKGCAMYFMPGHNASDFKNEAYARILVNAVRIDPRAMNG